MSNATPFRARNESRTATNESRWAATDALPILMYHSVPAEGPAQTGMQVRLSTLRAQLQALQADGWELCGLSEALSHREREPERRIVALTFDDGYADFLSAAGCLGDLGARATLYVSTHHVGAPRLIPEAGRLLTWDEIAELPTDTVEIGSHSHDHRPMDVLPRRAMAAQVHTSKALLEGRLGRQVESFCYPHGYASGAVQSRVEAAGFRNACVVGRRLATQQDSPFALPRLQVTDQSAQSVLALVRRGEPGLAARVKPALQPAWRVVRRVSKIAGHELT